MYLPIKFYASILNAANLSRETVPLSIYSYDFNMTVIKHYGSRCATADRYKFCAYTVPCISRRQDEGVSHFIWQSD
jgi:hypothetical protein